MKYTQPRSTVILDIETYRNYFLVVFRCATSGRTRRFEMHEDHPTLDIAGIKKILRNYRVVTFNGRNYDMPILMLALDEVSNNQLKEASDAIILTGLKPWEFERTYGVSTPGYVDHIDIFEVAPGVATSLKLYSGRIHCTKMQDLPIEPDARIQPHERELLATYCENDTQNTLDLYNKLRPQVELRERMSDEYTQDLRSKSDAQIAEAVIRSEIEGITGERIYKPDWDSIDRIFYYKPPTYIEYTTTQLQDLLQLVKDTKFHVAPSGSVTMPKDLDALEICLGDSRYRLGIGGLHSSESCVAHFTDDDHFLVDRDVASYYPFIMIGSGLAPKQMGRHFIPVFSRIVWRRIDAKKIGDETTADSLKITINGTFGKLGSFYSVLYSPNLMIQVTITGQLSLLMLIETLEEAGIPVVSGNTDGIVIRCPRDMRWKYEEIILDWEIATGFETEATYYRALYSRDVNNYVAVYQKPKEKKGKLTYSKGKGVYAEPGLMKNPQNQICYEAAIEYVVHGKDVREHIEECRDIRKFVTVRKVQGGAVKDDEYLGKVIRWYYAEGVRGHITYKTNGNTVPRTEHAMPLMELPEEFPDDVSYDWYVRETYSILNDMAAAADRSKDKAFQGRSGQTYGRKPDQKNIHIINLRRGVALCGAELLGIHDKWVEYNGVPDGHRFCAKCRKEDEL